MSEVTGVRTLGFLFADLRGYTHFIDEHGDAAAAGLVRDYRALVRASVARFAGKEETTEGDSFFVVFESVSGAVRCGIEILTACGANDPPIRLGVGVHAGEAAAGEHGFVAAPVNLAARLCAMASAGDILVTDTVRALTRSAVEARFQSLGARRLKGFEEPVPVWRIEVVGAARSAEDDRPSPTVARLTAAALVIALVYAGVYISLALSGRSFFGPPNPKLLLLVLSVIGPFAYLGNLAVSWAVVRRSPDAARVSARALIVLIVVVAIATPYFVYGLVTSGLAGPLGAAFIGLFGLFTIFLCLGTAYGLYRRRAWVVGLAYVTCAVMGVTFAALPVAIGGAWAIRQRRENALY